MVIPQFHFHFNRVDLLLCEDDTALQNSTADPQNKTSIFSEMFKLQYCIKFGQLILEKIIKIVATRCHTLRLKCTKFDFPLGELTVLPQTS